jgi:hypothetical protein
MYALIEAMERLATELGVRDPGEILARGRLARRVSVAFDPRS